MGVKLLSYNFLTKAN